MEKIYYYDEKGRPVFFVYLEDNPQLDSMTLHFSIPRNLVSTRNTETYIGCIEERKVDDISRNFFFAKLFETIRKECKY